MSILKKYKLQNKNLKFDYYELLRITKKNKMNLNNKIKQIKETDYRRLYIQKIINEKMKISEKDPKNKQKMKQLIDYLYKNSSIGLSLIEMKKKDDK